MVAEQAEGAREKGEGETAAAAEDQEETPAEKQAPGLMGRLGFSEKLSTSIHIEERQQHEQNPNLSMIFPGGP